MTVIIDQLSIKPSIRAAWTYHKWFIPAFTVNRTPRLSVNVFTGTADSSSTSYKTEVSLYCPLEGALSPPFTALLQRPQRYVEHPLWFTLTYVERPPCFPFNNRWDGLHSSRRLARLRHLGYRPNDRSLDNRQVSVSAGFCGICHNHRDPCSTCSNVSVCVDWRLVTVVPT